MQFPRLEPSVKPLLPEARSRRHAAPVDRAQKLRHPSVEGRADANLRRDKVPPVPARMHRHAIPKASAARGGVPERHPLPPARVYGLAEAEDGVRVRRLALQPLAAPADDLRAPVPRHCDEAVRHPHHRLIGRGVVSEAEANVAPALHRRGQQARAEGRGGAWSREAFEAFEQRTTHAVRVRGRGSRLRQGVRRARVGSHVDEHHGGQAHPINLERRYAGQ
mmetsp:Transcript_31807/g.101730  ORF Transcript_31807/g.101730 Transcript_31807/m.101730 type:complete len:221 (-) Transcript_31807:1414-2076(-)